MMLLRRLGIGFLIVQAVGASLWWYILLRYPASRALFMAKDAPVSTLFAFAVADGVLFIGAAIVSAFGFWKNRPWAWAVLCIHAGAAGYAALYCWTLVGLTGGEGLLGAVLMAPSLIVPGLLVWKLRPKEAQS